MRTEHSSAEAGDSDIFVWHGQRQDFAHVLRTSAKLVEGDRVQLVIDQNTGHQQPVAVWYGKVPLAEVPRAVAYLKSLSPAVIRPAELPRVENFHLRWGQPIETTGVRAADDAPFVMDTITVPYQNRFNALMFTSGFDFLPDGRALVCTVHGDVWLVSGVDQDLDRITWQRFATGLYHPLGLKVVDGTPVVLCRDRLTVLEDLNRDGEADVYRNFNDDLVITGQNHGYAMSLETDPAGNFYFIKSGNAPPHGGTMLKVAPDGSKLEVFATGYRHANGLGVSPTGLITSADNEGNWIPSTRIDVVREGGFYGHLPTHRRKTPPATYDPPDSQ